MPFFHNPTHETCAKTVLTSYYLQFLYSSSHCWKFSKAKFSNLLFDLKTAFSLFAEGVR